ncbi:hypothetical protein J0X12_05645 [Sneathiella sp. CAU 1612]|jgi:uncharacterized protein YjiS (DUF1127 family)|uniref:DUF1127 domain-containing protein n=1 Tax=Sneathiella sedimenti TaxID=2816034 RepID=A0ABS3F3U2_9PROT|nr:hypothetical protein [Sneathiella sedimenti]MBO0333084.1 hypothetical protein [Sneathiella sedimenti]
MATKTYVNGGKLHLAPVKEHVGASGIMGTLIATIFKWQERESMRHQLADLDKVFLTDMGLSDLDVKTETTKSFWQS